MRDSRPGLFKNWRFLQLSVLTIAFLVLSPFAGQSWLFQILVQLFMLNSLLVTLSAAGTDPGVRRTLWILWMVAALASLADYSRLSLFRVFGAHLELGCLALLLFGCVACTLVHINRNLRESMDGIFAALTVYLLLAYAFAMIFAMVRLGDPESFQMPASALANPPSTIRNEMIYFSFVTIATLGYGDIIPISPFARMLAVIEAVVGQFYVAVVVALLVGSLINRPRLPQDIDR